MDDVESLVETYLTLRKEREMLKAEYESKDSELKQDMEHIESALLDVCNKTNVNGLKTRHGSVTRQVKDRFFCTDWDNFKKFVEAEGSLDLLERRIHQRNFKEFMSEREGEGLPPGVNVLREFDIVVRKASSTSETSV
jgi:helix-turn-helix protein